MSESKIYHVRWERIGFEVFGFYNVEAEDKRGAFEKAKKRAADDFGFPLNGIRIGYVWDAGIHTDDPRTTLIK